MDLCCQSIFFDSIWDILACLQSILADSEVNVVRVKNRLDPTYNSLLSAGYRGVTLNLQVINQKTLELGVDSHVCEVQLVLKTLAKLKVC